MGSLKELKEVGISLIGEDLGSAMRKQVRHASFPSFFDSLDFPYRSNQTINNPRKRRLLNRSNPLLNPSPPQRAPPSHFPQLTLHIHDESSIIATKTFDVYLLGYGVQLRHG